MPRNDRKQDGFSLLEVTVAVAMLGMVAIIANAVMRNQTRIRSFMFSQSAYGDVEELLRAEILDKLIFPHVDPATGRCLNRALPINQPFDAGQTGIRFTITSTNPNQTSVPVIPSSAPAEVRSAALRCSRGAFRRPIANADFYFCVRISTTRANQDMMNQGMKKSSWLRSEAAFAEIQFSFRNLPAEAPATCQDFALRRAGGVMAMGLYWAHQRGDDTANSTPTMFHTLRRLLYVSPR